MSDDAEKKAREELLNQLINGTYDEKRQAAYVFGELEHDPDFDPTPVLYRTLVESDDEGVASEAALALAKMREVGLPWIIRGLGSEIYSVRYDCAHALRIFGGPWAIEAIPWLRDIIRNSSPELRIEAVGAIGSIGPLAVETVPEIVPEIVRYIGAEFETAAACLFALRNFGALAKPAIPALMQLIQSTDDDFRRSMALRTLADIELSPNKNLIDRLLAIRNYSSDSGILESLVDILANYCHRQPDRARQLDAELGTLGDSLNIALAIALKTTGSLSNKADSFIEQALRDSDPNRQELVRALLSYVSYGDPST